MSGQEPDPDRYKGMAMSREEWSESDVGKASTVACGWCGETFATPHDFYDHLDTVHPEKTTKAKQAKAKRGDRRG